MPSGGSGLQHVPPHSCRHPTGSRPQLPAGTWQQSADGRRSLREACQPLHSTRVMQVVERARAVSVRARRAALPDSPPSRLRSCIAAVALHCFQRCFSAPASACRPKGRRSWRCRDPGGLSSSSVLTTSSAGPTPGARSVRRHRKARPRTRRSEAPSWERQSAPPSGLRSTAPAALRLERVSACSPAASPVPLPRMHRPTSCSGVTTRAMCSACMVVATGFRSSVATRCGPALAVRRPCPCRRRHRRRVERRRPRQRQPRHCRRAARHRHLRHVEAARRWETSGVNWSTRRHESSSHVPLDPQAARKDCCRCRCRRSERPSPAADPWAGGGGQACWPAALRIRCAAGSGQPAAAAAGTGDGFAPALAEDAAGASGYGARCGVPWQGERRSRAAAKRRTWRRRIAARRA